MATDNRELERRVSSLEELLKDISSDLHDFVMEVRIAQGIEPHRLESFLLNTANKITRRVD